MRDFRTLLVWQKSSQLTIFVYNLIAQLPRTEQFDLVAQMRRAAQSIEMNIAEGCGRKGEVEFARFLHIAMGSAGELECALDICNRRGFGQEAQRLEAAKQVVEVKKMLASLIRKLIPNRYRR
jgi:four helix bundle protein